ncbi:MAG: FKBP-type peptidyl-prolyl cis-trans isomerase, partial [Verrucomicrobia bacterium]|nr:FKBP-type peptidyl-prolyl cis-trans isomerase [Verrucomicrobiota bacterium]
QGEGEKPSEQDRVVVTYRGTLIDGREFDAGERVEFALNRVVPGFAEGIRQLRPGGMATLYLPADLAYGGCPARPGSIIEPGSTLIFEVTLHEVRAAPPPRPATLPVLPYNQEAKVLHLHRPQGHHPIFVRLLPQALHPHPHRQHLLPTADRVQ